MQCDGEPERCIFCPEKLKSGLVPLTNPALLMDYTGENGAAAAAEAAFLYERENGAADSRTPEGRSRR